MTSWFSSIVVLLLSAGQAAAAEAVPYDNVNKQALGDQLLPISMKCPAENSGTIEYVGKNAKGFRARVRATYRNNSIVRASYETAAPGEPYKTYVAAELGNPPDPEDVHIVERIEVRIAAVKEKICQGSGEIKQAYERFLQSNREALAAGYLDDSVRDPSGTTQPL